MNDSRSAPNDLLARLKGEERVGSRGKLRTFFSASTCVGRT